MTTSTTPGRPGALVACVAGPLGLGALLNAVIRPALADALGGTAHSTGAGIRSNDVWWGFDAATRQAHPLLTAFLGVSHGAIGIAAVALVVVLLTCRGIVRARRRGPTPRPTRRGR